MGQKTHVPLLLPSTQLRGHLPAKDTSNQVIDRARRHVHARLEGRAPDVRHDDAPAPCVRLLSRRLERRHAPWFFHQRVVLGDARLALDDIQPCAPDPLLAQRGGQRFRVDDGPAAGIDEHAHLLHLAQECGVHEMIRLLPTGREHEQDITFAREAVDVHALERHELVLRLQRCVARVVGL